MHDVEVYQKSVEHAVVNVLLSKPQFFLRFRDRDHFALREGALSSHATAQFALAMALCLGLGNGLPNLADSLRVACFGN